MSRGTYRLMVDWNNDGDFSDTGEELDMGRILDLTWSRGRDFASQLTGRSKAGTLRAVLNNESGDYSSFNTGSPIAGNILPGRKVQLQGGHEGFPYTFPFVFTDTPLWTGYLLRVQPQPHAGGVKTALLEAIGPLGYLNQRSVSLAMGTSKLTGTSIGEILDEVGWAAGDRTIDTGQTTMTRFWVDRNQFLTAIRKVEETEAGFIAESADGKIVFEDRHHRLASPHTVSQATFSDAGAAARTYQGIDQEDPLPHIFNIMEAEVILFTVAGAASVAWILSEVGASSPKVERNGGARTFWASYPNPDSASDGWGIAVWTTPVATTDFLANSAAGGGGTNLTTSIGVAVTAFGNSLKITLTNNHATLDAYLTFLQARGTVITKDDPVKVSSEDTTSQGKYGERTYPNPGEFIPDTQEAQDWADLHKGIYKDPLPILALHVNANKDDTHMFEVLLRDISERITLVATGKAGLGINEDFFIESMQHHVGRDRRHDVVWMLSQAARYSDFWVLDTSALDVSTRLAY